MDAPRLDAERLNAALSEHKGAAPFMSAASPGVTALFFGNEHYASHEVYVFAIAVGLRHEYETIAGAGIMLQIDCPDLAMGRHTQFAELDLKGFRDRMALNIEAINRAVANIPAEQLRMHMCWGNYPGPHHCDVPFKDIIDMVWRAKPHAIQFEAANPRHAHEFEMFESVKLPEGKVLIPGVIAHTTAVVEHPETVAERLMNYARVVGRERVMAGADCGFAQGALYQRQHPTVMWAKFEALVQGAQRASERLWRS
jgi:5-methyltetrahydropteroyltriglutamate--homocysteine methyltransferase